MKKPININLHLTELTGKFRRDFFKELFEQFKSVRFKTLSAQKNLKVQKIAFTLLFLILLIENAVAPSSNTLTIVKPSPIQPFNDLMHAIGIVETKENPMAYNILENAVGIFQIRQVRLDEYNRKTGSNYRLKDMFNRKLSEKVFLYFASRYQPYDLERIAKSWNGSGPKTEYYWRRIKKFLD